MKVKFENIVKEFGSTVAVKKISAELPDGHLICLLGPSGCGKSTILNMLCGIIPVTSGNIYFDDKDVTKLPPDQRNIGMVFQNYALYPHMTVFENIRFPLEVQKVSKKERQERINKIAQLVQVSHLLKRYPSELSGGQQQRVAIARALIKNPKLLLMDEPLSNLDARLRLEMREEIRRIQQETGVTTIFVTHDQEEAMSISDSILLMKDGELIQKGLCQDLYKEPECRFVAEFLGNPPINQIKLEINQIKDILQNVNPTLDLASTTEEQLILEVRPESIISSENQPFDADVLSISEMGKEQIITLKIFNHTVRAIFNNDQEYHTGDKIKVGFKSKGIFVFEENGKRLA